MFSSFTPEETPEEEEDLLFFPARLRSESCWVVGVEKSDSMSSFWSSFTGVIVETWDLMIVVVDSRLGIGKEETLVKFDAIGDGYGRRPVKKAERRLMVWRFVDKTHD
ncbi:Uncharacterized protein Rs2_27379 [Raphanus sativus]|nr:Uncharacterized protein Rs2_27379 [Raphanus sativus]